MRGGIHGNRVRKVVVDPGEQNPPRDSPVCCDNVSNTSEPTACSSWGGGYRFVGTGFDPGIRGLALSVLFELLKEFSKPATKDPPCTGAAQTAA